MATYYVKAAGGTGAGTSDGTAWSYAHFKSRTLAAGDTVLFNRGDVFYGDGLYTLNQTGTESNRITFGAYGTGDKPIVTGFSTLTGWTLHTTGIYYKDVPAYATTTGVSKLRTVTVDGIGKSVGRMPKTGYYNIDSATATTLTSSSLVGGPSYAGGKLIAKILRYAVNHADISAHNTSTGVITHNLTSTAPSNWGFFIMEHISTLTQLGDWYFDPTAERLYMYFGANTPSNYVVKMGTFDYAWYLHNRSYVTVDNIAFEGLNMDGVRVNSTNGVTFSNCEFRFMRLGIEGTTVDNLLVEDCSFSYCNDRAIKINTLTNGIIRRNNISNIGMDLTLASGVTGAINAIFFDAADNVLVENNIMELGGGNAVRFHGSNITINKNFFKNFVQMLDDQGYISTYLNTVPAVLRTNQVVSQNIFESTQIGIVEQGIPSGKGLVEMLYLDDNSHNVEVLNNFVVGLLGDYQGAGIYFHNAFNIKAHGNTTGFHSGYAFKMRHNSPNAKFTNLDIQDNIFYCHNLNANGSDGIYTIGITDDAGEEENWGIIDNNVYAKPASRDGAHIRFGRPLGAAYSGNTTANYTLAQWQGLTGQDANSSLAPTGISTLQADAFYAYNATDNPVEKTAPWIFKDMRGNVYGTSYTLQPWTGVIGVKATDGSTPETLVVPTAISATNIISTSFTANWQTAGGATNYRLDVSTQSNFSSFVSGYNDLSIGNVLSVSVTGIVLNVPYYYRVRSENIYGISANSNTITVAAFSIVQENLITDPEAINVASWTKTNSSVVTDATTAPSGTVSAEKVNTTLSSAGYTGVSKLVSVTGTVHTFGIRAKIGEVTWIRLQPTGSSNDGDNWFNISTGVLGTITPGIIASIEADTEGYYKCYVSFNVPSAKDITVHVRLASGNNVTTYSGVGNGAFFWGAQLNKGIGLATYTPEEGSIPGTPSAPTIVTVGSTFATINITSVATATHYKVYRSGTIGGTYTLVNGNVPSGNFTDNGLASGANHYYKVIASNANGDSELSAASAVATTSSNLIVKTKNPFKRKPLP